MTETNGRILENITLQKHITGGGGMGMGILLKE